MSVYIPMHETRGDCTLVFGEFKLIQESIQVFKEDTHFCKKLQILVKIYLFLQIFVFRTVAKNIIEAHTVAQNHR